MEIDQYADIYKIACLRRVLFQKCLQSFYTHYFNFLDGFSFDLNNLSSLSIISEINDFQKKKLIIKKYVPNNYVTKWVASFPIQKTRKTG